MCKQGFTGKSAAMKTKSLGVSDEKWHCLSQRGWQVIYSSRRSGRLESNSDPRLYPRRSISSPTACTDIHMHNILFLTSLSPASAPWAFLFSVSLLFAEFAGLLVEAQELEQPRGTQGPFVHNSGQIKIGILARPAGDQISSINLLRMQNLDPPVVS